jgi:plasmid stabilization system protein ParE
MNVEVLASAAREFRDALRWYREKSETAARRFAIEVTAAIAAIEERPDSYARWDDTFRFYLVNRFPYYIAYRYEANRVVIVAIRHAARDQDAWQDR